MIGGIVIDPYLIGLKIDCVITIGGVGNKLMLGIGSIANDSLLNNSIIFQLNSNTKNTNKNNKTRCSNCCE